MIDPGIWTDVRFARLTVPQRLLFIGIFSNADDDGRLRGEPEFLKMVIFPSDGISATAIVDMTKSLGDMIIRYETDGRHCIQLKNWGKHQYIRDRRPSTLPPPIGYTPPPTLPPTHPTPNTGGGNPTQSNPKQGKKVVCPRCAGKGECGRAGYEEKCPTCKGERLIWREDAEMLAKLK
jgi:hypothetical protein